MSEEDLWYRIGYAIERARTGTDNETESTALARLRDRVGHLAGTAAPVLGRKLRTSKPSKGVPSTDALMLAAYTSLGVSVLKRWRPRHRAGFLDLIRGGAAGAAAALLVEILRPVILGADREDDDDELVRAVLAGVGEGMVYAAAIEPRLPGPPSARGAAFGTASYMLAPLGGLTRLLRPLSPHRKLPGLSSLLEDGRSGERNYLETLVIGMAVAIFYGTADSRGISDELP